MYDIHPVTEVSSFYGTHRIGVVLPILEGRNISVPKTWCFINFRILNDGQSPETQWMWEYTVHATILILGIVNLLPNNTISFNMPWLMYIIWLLSTLTFTLYLFQLGTQFIYQFFYSTFLKERKTFNFIFSIVALLHRWNGYVLHPKGHNSDHGHCVSHCIYLQQLNSTPLSTWHHSCGYEGKFSQIPCSSCMPCVYTHRKLKQGTPGKHL
jgi:hypothetical protein